MTAPFDNLILDALQLAEQTDYSTQKLGSLHVLNRLVRRLPVDEWQDFRRWLAPYVDPRRRLVTDLDAELTDLDSHPEMLPRYVKTLSDLDVRVFLAAAANFADPPAEWSLEQIEWYNANYVHEPPLPRLEAIPVLQQLQQLSPDDLLILPHARQSWSRLKRNRKLDFFVPYPKQLDFIANSFNHDELALIAANQVGKTEVAGYTMAVHLTGEYPKWWPGRRFSHAITAWTANETAELTRDIQQERLCGPAGIASEHGTGYLPLESFVDKPTTARGVSDGYDTIHISHKTHGSPDGISTLVFKSYREGRENFQAATLHLFWGDEESDPEVYSECRTRLSRTKGLSFVTFTPLKGRTPVVIRFLDEPAPGRAYTQMGLLDARHFTKEEADKIIAGHPAHQRRARAFGEPQLGSGRIFEHDEESFKHNLTKRDIPSYWTKLGGLDFGIGHSFAYVLSAWDRESNIIYLIDGFKVAGQTPTAHVPRIRQIAGAVKVAWPHDGNQRDKGSGATLADLYEHPINGEPGLKMLPEHATWPEGGYSTERAIAELDERIKARRFLVAAHLAEWFAEYRQYHRDEKGGIVKLNDDLLSATFKILMCKTEGRPGDFGSGRRSPQSNIRWNEPAAGSDFDIFSGRPLDPWER